MRQLEVSGFGLRYQQLFLAIDEAWSQVWQDSREWISPRRNFFIFFSGALFEAFRLTSWPQVVGRPQVREWQRGDIHMIPPRGWDNSLHR